MAQTESSFNFTGKSKGQTCKLEGKKDATNPAWLGIPDAYA